MASTTVSQFKQLFPATATPQNQAVGREGPYQTEAQE